jgi:hypothetical protein
MCASRMKVTDNNILKRCLKRGCFADNIKESSGLLGPTRPHLTATVTKFSKTKMHEPLENCRSQNGDMEQVQKWGPTNIGRHHTKFSPCRDLKPQISASLSQCILYNLVPFFLLNISGSTYPGFNHARFGLLRNYKFCPDFRHQFNLLKLSGNFTYRQV